MSSLFAKRNYFWNWSWTAAGGKICFNHTHKEGQEKCNNLTNSFNNFDKSMLQVWQPEPASTIFARQYRLSEFLTRQDKDRAWFRLFVYFFKERKTIQRQYYHLRSDKYVTLIRNGSLFATILVKVWQKSIKIHHLVLALYHYRWSSLIASDQREEQWEENNHVTSLASGQFGLTRLILPITVLPLFLGSHLPNVNHASQLLHTPC